MPVPIAGQGDPCSLPILPGMQTEDGREETVRIISTVEEPMEITRQEMNEFWAQEQASAREVQGHLLASQRTVVGTIAECALGCNARTYNPICNAHAPKLANTNYGGWQGSNDEITWCAIPSREAANLFRYQRKVLVTPVQPIPEPAPELCAYKDCREAPTDAVHRCIGSCPTPCPRNTLGCHPFVAPQAKPVIAKPADIYAGPPITGAFHNVVQAKPVLREPKPRADGYPDVCLECRGEKGDGLYFCSSCFRIDGLRTFYDRKATWDALHRKPAAKDIPSPVADTPTLGVEHQAAKSTEAARGGEAAISRSIHLERGLSAVAAAPGIEPWRPSVDDWDLLPDATEGWCR